MNHALPMCCGQVSKWIENIPGRGYAFCGECRKEVVAEPAPSAYEKALSDVDEKDLQSAFEGFTYPSDSFSVVYDKPGYITLGEYDKITQNLYRGEK